MHKRWTGFSAILLTVCAAASALACQIPVFRFALEKWQPDPYVLYVAHRGALSAADKTLVEQLEQTVRDQNESLNLVVSVVDLAEKKDAVLEFLLGEKIKSIDSPELVLVYPFNLVQAESAVASPNVDGRTPVPPSQTPVPPGRTAAPPGLTAVPSGLTVCPTGTCNFDLYPPRIAWSGELSAERIEQVLDSPARQQIAERILDGQSAVWVLVESNDSAKNAAALAKLEQTLAKMQQVLKLPDKEAIEADEFYEPETKVELRIEFSIVRIPYERGEDTVFASTLLAADPEVAGSEEPVTMSVFGRGRSFFALAGEDINAEAVEEHCRFLIGDCSCRVKQENPGTDLLFAVAWDKSIKGSSFSEKPLPELTGIGQIGGNQGFPTGFEGTSKPKEADKAENNASASTEPAIAASQDPLATSQQTPASSTPVADAPTSLTATSLNWIFGLAALALLFIFAGTIWLRFGA